MDGVNITITDEEEVIVKDVPYYQKLTGVLEKFSKR